MSRGLPPIIDRGLAVLPAAVSAVLALVLGVQLAHLVWAFVPVPTWTPPPVTVDRKDSASKTVDLDLIVSAALFGRYEVPKTRAAIEDAPDTRLNLKLIGILANTDTHGSRALIESSDGQEKPYAINDDIDRGVSLQAIFPDRVILSRAGQLETLRLDKDKPSAATDSRYLPGQSGGDNAVDVAELTQIRETLLADPSRAQEFIRVVPANVGGNQRGYRIYPGRNRSLFSAAGLRPGDLVTAVNGVELNDPARALQLLGELSQATSVNLSVERGGQLQNYTLSIN
ncbi:type II secretion system protein GspC [Algiphilus sp. W345]|uniref:Type II secretion system protein GspC n=1 Tax=Banduia mediterranea TaxID=3075609 RepID=A0ABU2WKC2_9GAMM|nr:type II secretion system protein GspC [Algiphilus sp. W345]MDT0498333.1 type II secretion system protein GspC [Algiphilus sp. W345]